MQVQTSAPFDSSHFVKQQKVEKTFKKFFQAFQLEFKGTLTNIESKVETYSSDIYKTIKLDLIENNSQGISQSQVEFFDLLMKIASLIVYALDSTPVAESLFDDELPLLQTLLQISNEVSVASLGDFSKGLSKKQQILNFDSFEYEQGQKYDPSERIIPEFLTLLHHVIMGISFGNTYPKIATYVNGQEIRLSSTIPNSNVEDGFQPEVNVAKQIMQDVKSSRKNKSISEELEKKYVIEFSNCVLQLIDITNKSSQSASPKYQVKNLRNFMRSIEVETFKNECTSKFLTDFLEFIHKRCNCRLNELEKRL